MIAEIRRRPPGFFGGEDRSESSDEAVALWRFIAPRHWRGWLLVIWLRIASILPWRASLGLHRRLGRFIGRRSRKARRLVDENLARCFPELDADARKALSGEFFANMGAIVAELALAWFWPRKRLRRLFTVEGVEHLEQALAGGRGVILCAGHFTPIELASVAVADHAPRYVLLFNKRRSRLLSEIQRRARARYSHAAFEKRKLRPVLRSLGENSVVWISADEAHTGKSSALLPFFGEPALTNTSLSRLARISGAAIVPLFFCRRDDGSGYVIRFEPALADFPSEDIVADTRRLIAVLENQIRECPAQYFWKQKRFRRRREETESSVEPGDAEPAGGTGRLSSRPDS